MLCCQSTTDSPLIIFSSICFYEIEKTGSKTLIFKDFRPVNNITCAPVIDISKARFLCYRYLTDYQFSPETYHDYSYDSRQPAPIWCQAFRNYNTDRWINLHVEGIYPILLYILVQEV